MEPNRLEAIYRRYAGELYLYAFSLCQERTQAQDLVSEAFCRALLSLDGEEESWKGWLFVALLPGAAQPHRLCTAGGGIQRLLRPGAPSPSGGPP